MSRIDGKKLVSLAAVATLGAIGIGTIYLPFLADRDKLRGFFEEGEDSIPEGARREVQAVMKAEREKEEQQQEQQQHSREEERPQQQRQRETAGSMWSSFRRNS